jgi:hypothetical protein
MPSGMAGNKRYFHQTFAAPPHNHRYLNDQVIWPHDLHRTRDASALVEVSDSLNRAGYDFEETILGLYPEPKTSRDACSPSPLKFGPELRAGDLLVMTTRPPLDDDEGDAMNRIRGSGSPQEKAVLDTLRAVFLAHSSRTTIRLQEPIYHLFKNEDLLQPRSLAFFSREGRLGEKHQRDRTICFLLRAPQIQGLQPHVGCLCIFGMAGAENLIWARTLRKERSILASASATPMLG